MAITNATVLTTSGKAIVTGLTTFLTSTKPQYLGVGNGATAGSRTAAVGDTALSAEIGSGSRITCTLTQQTTSVANDTVQCVGTWTSGGTYTIDEAFITTNQTIGTNTATNGIGAFISTTIVPQVGLLSGDAIQITAKCQFT